MTYSFKGQTDVISVGYPTLPNLNHDSSREWRNWKLFVIHLFI